MAIFFYELSKEWRGRSLLPRWDGVAVFCVIEHSRGQGGAKF